jgi:uncharacterized protein
MTKQNNSIAVTAIISGVILIVALVALFTLGGSSSSKTDVVNVQGIATVEAMPDLVGVYFNIESKGETSAEAEDLNTEIFNELVTELVLLGFERKEIVTENFNVYPNYDWTEDGREEDGYVATHSVKIKMPSEDSDKLGDIIDAGVEAGAGISYINFELSQELQNEYKAEAMKLAAGDAKIKAESVAEGFDKKIGKLVSVQVNEFGYYPWNIYSTRGGGYIEDAVLAKETASSIQPGEKEVSATVSASFKLR